MKKLIKATVKFDNCKYCKKCLAQKACTTKALYRFDEDEPVAVDTNLCYGCAKCVAACPFDTMAIKEL